MPMHDWTRVAPNYYHDFHVGWIAALRQHLNTGGLPRGFYALAEQSVPPVVPDVLTLEVPSVGGPPTGNGTVGTGPSPATAVLDAGRRQPPRIRSRRLAVRHADGHRLVAVIEIVSPGNKSGRRDFLRFVDKAVELVEDGIHLLIVDPFPPTPRDPRGLHAAVWRELVGKRFTPPAGRPLTLAAYEARADDTFAAFVEPLAVGDRLPDMPIFLAPGRHVPVPLEPTYQTAWAGFPSPWREVVEGR